MVRTKTTTLLFFLLNAAVLSAQTLTVGDCVDMALRENKDVKSATWRVEQQKHTKASLKANYFPKLSVQVTDLWSSIDGRMEMDIASPMSEYISGQIHDFAPEFSSSELGVRYLSTLGDRLSGINPIIDYSVNNIVSAMAQIEQPIYTGGKINAAYRMGQLGERMAELGVGISEEEVILKTHEAYSLVIKAKEMYVVAHQYDSLLVQIRQTVESAVKNGMARNADLVKVQAAIGKSELQLHQAENGIKLATMNLCQIIGLPLFSRIDVTPMEVATGMNRTDGEMGVSARKEYLLLDMKAQLAAEQVKLERSNFLPQAVLLVAGGYVNGGRMLNQPVFDNKMHTMVAFNVKIPIFHAGEGRHKVLAARAEYEQARLEQEQLDEMMALEIQQALNRFDEAVLETSLKEKLVDQAAEGLRMSRKAYDNGMETIADLLTAQTEWQNAYAELVEARHNQVLKELAWRKAAGLLGNDRTIYRK